MPRSEYHRSRDTMTREERDAEVVEASFRAFTVGLSENVGNGERTTARASLKCVERGRCVWCNLLAGWEVLSVDLTVLRLSRAVKDRDDRWMLRDIDPASLIERDGKLYVA